MNTGLTEIIFLLDRSGSMHGLESDTIGGFNSFLDSQRRLGRTLITTVLFDDRYEILHSGIPAEGVRLSEREYYTRGRTALLDAVGKTIIDVGVRLSNAPEYARPGKVIFVITTDGLENASREYTYGKVQEMIAHQRDKYSWEFIFMGANINVEQESRKLGIDRRYARAYTASPAGTKQMFAEVAQVAQEMRQTR